MMMMSWCKVCKGGSYINYIIIAHACMHASMHDMSTDIHT